MEDSISTKKLLIIFSSIVLSTVLIFANGFLIFADTLSRTISDATPASIDANGNQVILLKAKGGFEPRLSSILPNKPAVLRVDTSNTFDCSSTLSIPKLGINETLPSTGTKEFKIPPQTADTVIDGTCSMGMYNFKIIAQ